MVDLVILLSTKVQILKSKSFDLGLEIFDFDFSLDNMQTIGSELYDIRFNQFVLTIIIRAFDLVNIFGICLDTATNTFSESD